MIDPWLRGLPRLIKRRGEAEPGRTARAASEKRSQSPPSSRCSGERGQGVDAAEGTQARDRRPQSLVGGQPREALVERALALAQQTVDGGEQVDERELGRLVIEALAARASGGGACSRSSRSG